MPSCVKVHQNGCFFFRRRVRYARVFDLGRCSGPLLSPIRTAIGFAEADERLDQPSRIRLDANLLR